MNDLDLMLLADGEADPSTADRARAAAASDRSKIEGIQELGGLVRGHLELSADDAEDRLAGLWDLVERRLDADVRAEAPVATPVGAASPGLWARVAGWFGSYRSQVLTGVVAAGAAAAIVTVARPAHQTTRIVERQVPVAIGPGTGAGTAAGPILVVNRGTPAEIESLDVSGGTGTVFAIDDDDAGEGETTVIWVTPDDVKEGL